MSQPRTQRTAGAIDFRMRLWVAAGLLGCCGVVFAAAGDKGRNYYRCTDAQGVRRYADSMPFECQGQDTQVLDSRGNVISVIEGVQSQAQHRVRDVAEAIEQKKRDESAQHDRMLIDTYLTTDDIVRLRDQRLELMDSQIKLTGQNVAATVERQHRLLEQAQRFKPYSDKPKAFPMPDHVAEELISTVNALRTYQTMEESKRTEQRELTASFDRDIKRFKELKGIK
jgi:hypothetical protein